uniref:Lipid storage droplets surface-binding protein 1 n=2 Tax=Cacopsylla melanoneura TaxID=428564 RepID=A0A8D9A2S3_9HEMI
MGINLIFFFFFFFVKFFFFCSFFSKSFRNQSSLQKLNMTVANKKVELPHLTSVDRIFKIPLVDSGYHIVTILYGKVKYTNGLITWGFTTAEKSLFTALDLTKPTVAMFEQPIMIVDSLLCKSLDSLEQRVPVINYSPEVLYHLTRDYASRNVLQPMMKRAESVKEISYNKANVAAEKIDSVLNIADKYVDKYLPDDGSQPDNTDSAVVPADSSNTKKTIVHMKNFRSKLQRRITYRAIIEAKALKRQGADTLQAIMYMLDLLARDPKKFFQKVKELWDNLSADEPENQARPNNLEEFIVMLTREASRKLVHLVNYTSGLVLNRMDIVQHYLQEVSHFVYIQARKSADLGFKQSALAIEQSKKVAEIALQRTTTLFDLVYRSGLLKYKEINQILDEFIQHAIKLFERLAQHQSRQHQQQQNVSPAKSITPPQATSPTTNTTTEHKTENKTENHANNVQPKTKTPEQKNHKKERANHSPSSPQHHNKDHTNGQSPQNGQINGS